MNDKNTSGVRNCHTFLPTPSLSYFTFAHAVLFLHGNHVTSQGREAYCDSLAGISVFFLVA